jgi:hypothetical protein
MIMIREKGRRRTVAIGDRSPADPEFEEKNGSAVASAASYDELLWQ